LFNNLFKFLKKYTLEKAIEKYYSENLDLSAGAKLAGISKRDFQEELTRKGINLSKEDYDYSKKSFEKLFGKNEKKKTTQKPK